MLSNGWSSFPDGGDPMGACGTVSLGDGGTLDNVCSQGICACPQGYGKDDAGNAVDFCTDDANCGSLGQGCTGSLGCFGGVCGHPAQPAVGRGNAAAVAAGDGRIYLLGGFENAGNPASSARVEAFDPRNNAWIPQPSLQDTRAALQASVDLQGGIYAIGGVTFTSLTGSNPQSTVEHFDLAQATWSYGPALANGAWLGGAGLGDDGNVYLVTGEMEVGGTDAIYGQTFSLSGSAWRSVAPRLIDSCSIAVTTTPSGQLVACSGTAGLGPVGDCEQLDPAGSAPSWTEMPPLPTPRCYAAAASAADGRLGVFGGDDCTDTGPALDTVELYSWVADGGFWVTSEDGGIPPLPEAVADTAAARGADGRVYVLVGADSAGFEQFVQVLSADGSRWAY